MFFDPRDIAPKCIFGYYSCYLQDRREFKPTRVVYFFTRNTMVLFILLYLEKRGCYSRFYRIFSLKSDKKLPFDPYLTPNWPLKVLIGKSNQSKNVSYTQTQLFIKFGAVLIFIAEAMAEYMLKNESKCSKMSLNIQKPKIGPLWRHKGKFQNLKNGEKLSEVYLHYSFYYFPKIGREVWFL